VYLEADRMFPQVKSDDDWQLSGVIFLALDRKPLDFGALGHVEVHFKSELISYQASDYIRKMIQWTSV
jgi:hypothetical protein